MPVPFARREPDDIAGINRLNWTAFALRQARASRNDQRLAEWMCVPGGTSSRFECNRRASDAAGAGAWNNGSIRTVPVNQSAGPLVDGCEPVLLISMLIFSD